MEINGNKGETIKVETANSENAFIKVLSDSNFTTEVAVEESDIANIQIGQFVEITLEAIEDTVLTGQVSFISSTAAQDNNGIVTYLVKIDIAETNDAPIREGMTTEVNFIIGQALDVLAVPNEVLVDENFVLLQNGERREVVTGFSDGNLIEIKSGLAVGDIVLFEEGDAVVDASAGESTLAERMEAVGERLEKSGTKPPNWDRMSDKEKQDFLQELRAGDGESGRPAAGGRPAASGRPSN